MRILITSGNSRLAWELFTVLTRSHTVRLTDRSAGGKGPEVMVSALGHDESTNQLVRSMDAIVHLGQSDSPMDVSELLDYQTRCTYNLLRAAVEERVPRFVYLSSLAVMGRYPEDLVVTERWRPTPTTEPSVLACHLGEFICREFAREGRISVVCLRLGELVWDEANPGKLSTSALALRDAIHAVERALVAPVTQWGLFHIQSPVPRARFLTLAAQRGMGYTPQFTGRNRR